MPAHFNTLGALKLDQNKKKASRIQPLGCNPGEFNENSQLKVNRGVDPVHFRPDPDKSEF